MFVAGVAGGVRRRRIAREQIAEQQQRRREQATAQQKRLHRLNETHQAFQTDEVEAALTEEEQQAFEEGGHITEEDLVAYYQEVRPEAVDKVGEIFVRIASDRASMKSIYAGLKVKYGIAPPITRKYVLPLSEAGTQLFAQAMGGDASASASAAVCTGDAASVTVIYTGWLLKRRTVVHHKLYCALLSSGYLLLFEDKADADVALSYHAELAYTTPLDLAHLPPRCPPHAYIQLDAASAKELAFTFYGVGLSVGDMGHGGLKKCHLYSMSAKEDHELLEWQRMIRRVAGRTHPQEHVGGQ
jgi:hypothetical protein